MKLEKNSIYITDTSSIKVWITDIWDETSEYYIVNGVISHRRLGFWYEAGDYKLYKDKITHWKLYN